MAGEAKDKDISWFSPNGEKLTPNQQRISVVWNDDSSSTLTIYNADIDDAGIYKCVVTGEDGSESEATVNVKIFRKSPLLLLYMHSSLARKIHGQQAGWDGNRGPAEGLTGLLSILPQPKYFLNCTKSSNMHLNDPGPTQNSQLGFMLVTATSHWHPTLNSNYTVPRKILWVLHPFPKY